MTASSPRDRIEQHRAEYEEALTALALAYPDISERNSNDAFLADRVAGKCLESRFFSEGEPSWTAAAASCALVASSSHSHWFRERGFDAAKASDMACRLFFHCLAKEDQEGAGPGAGELAQLLRCSLRESVPEPLRRAAFERAAHAPQSALAGACALFMRAIAGGGPLADNAGSAQKRKDQLLAVEPLLETASLQRILDHESGAEPKFKEAYRSAHAELSRRLLSRGTPGAGPNPKSRGL